MSGETRTHAVVSITKSGRYEIRFSGNPKGRFYRATLEKAHAYLVESGYRPESIVKGDAGSVWLPISDDYPSRVFINAAMRNQKEGPQEMMVFYARKDSLQLRAVSNMLAGITVDPADEGKSWFRDYRSALVAFVEGLELRRKQDALRLAEVHAELAKVNEGKP